MIRTSIGRRTSDGTAAAAALEVIAGAKGFFLRELWLSMAAATASIYGLGVPAAKGITPTTPVTNLVEGAPATTPALVTTAIAWATGPTVPAAFFRRIGLQAAIGAGLPAPWTFGNQGLYVPAGTSIVLWNIGTNGIVDVDIVVDEQT
jgi:hypothetical protein